VREDVSQTDDDVHELQQQELEFIQKLLGSNSTKQVDSTSPPAKLERSEEVQEEEQQDYNEQPQQQQQQQQQEKLNMEEVEADEKQEHAAAEDGEIDSQIHSEPNTAQQTVEENARQSPQQQETEQLAMSESPTDDSQKGPLLCASLPVMGLSRTHDVQHGERPISGKQTVNVQVNMKTSTAPEKKQQVAVVHAHERTYPRVENRALSRIRDEELQTSMSRQPTLESHLSIESTSSHQLSQASLLWQNEQLQAGTRQQDLEQTASLQQQYEQLKYQLQQQLELQRSQLEREYQLRDEQMKQQMMMQWQYFTQQQQQLQPWQMFPGVRQDHDTHFQDDPRRISGFPRAPGRTDIPSTCYPLPAQRQVQPPQSGLTDDRQRCACDNTGAVAAKDRQNHQHQPRSVVVDVVSHTRGRDGGGQGGWPGHDGGHCRIMVDDGERRRGSSDSDTQSEDQASGAVDWDVCATCGLCRRQCETSDGKGRRCNSHRGMACVHDNRHCISPAVTRIVCCLSLDILYAHYFIACVCLHTVSSGVKVSRNAPERRTGAWKFKPRAFRLQNCWISQPKPTFLGPAS